MRHIPVALLEAYLLIETLNRFCQPGWSWIDPALILAVILPLHLLIAITLHKRTPAVRSTVERPTTRGTPLPTQPLPSQAPQQQVVPQPAPQRPQATLVANRHLTHKTRPDRECHRRANAHIHNT